MEVNYSQQEINVKIVYYGPGRSGKTTNLEIIHAKTPENNRGRLTAISTDQDRTLFFDYMPIDIGKIGNFKVKLRLFTVPGQVYYNNTRKLVLRCVDGVVFVADSQVNKIAENIESLQNLRENLIEQNESIQDIPLLLQFNKRDLPDIMPMEELNSILNETLGAPYYAAVAVKGEGVFQCLKHIANLTMAKVGNLLKQKPKRVVKRSSRDSTEEAVIEEKSGLTPAIPQPAIKKETPIYNPAVTPPRGLPILPSSEEKSTRVIPISRGTINLNLQNKKPTISKPNIPMGTLFQGSLSNSKPSKPSATPPKGNTPISNPTLPKTSKPAPFTKEDTLFSKKDKK